ncbi:MAG: NAD(P)/FAD-dependent oxidoreductase [Xanthomonadales bacterium]|nr:NAD(P)/FAD-dependent oxidoreductase [Xanthomonadales bacterium]
MKTPDLIIIGAGAAGLLCAVTAAARGRRVLVLERSNKAGKKILMSGGGRCNFTNLHITPERYLSTNPHFCKSALSRYTQWDFIELVEQHGIEYFEKSTVNGLSGQLFCRQSSKQILAMLLDECRSSGVEIKLNCEIESVMHRAGNWQLDPRSESTTSQPKPRGDDFYLATSLGCFTTGVLVVAAGGLSVPSLGGSGIGYQLATCFGLGLQPTFPGLVPLTFSGVMHGVCKDLSGVSTEVCLRNGKRTFREDMLFTHRGLSGPAVLQLSSYWKAGDVLSVDLLPEHAAAKLFLAWKQQHPGSLLRKQLDRELPRKLVRVLEQSWWPELADTPLAEWPDKRLRSVAGQLQSWSLKPAGTEGYRTAEVTLGGVDTRELSSKTMESGIPGLFFIGEVVDVSGHLGGFNFQWAWSSGFVAGQAV